MPLKNKLIVFFTVTGVLMSYFLVPFLFGFCNAPYGASFFPLVLCWLLEPPIAGFITASCIKASMPIKSAIGTGTAIALYFAFFLLLPGATSQTLGLTANFILTKHPEQIQQWAIQVLDRYDAGKLGLTTNVEYWAVGTAKLEDSEIPPQIKDLWWNRPSIGVATITDDGWLTESMRTNIAIIPGGQPVPVHLSHCVAFSWYETGFLVGRPDFQSKWNPWYLHEIRPGIYVFCGEH